MARPKTKTNSQIKNDYAKKAYEDVRLQVKRGQKELLREFAISNGHKSLQGYIKDLLKKDSGLDL